MRIGIMEAGAIFHNICAPTGRKSAVWQRPS
nr:MAG TPA: hypothetical protein [Caudoviricetes sp.]